MKHKNISHYNRRCCHLYLNGKQCSNTITYRNNYHGDPELVGLTNRAHWVRVYFCKKHIEAW
jgi:hypothetical protein